MVGAKGDVRRDTHGRGCAVASRAARAGQGIRAGLRGAVISGAARVGKKAYAKQSETAAKNKRRLARLISRVRNTTWGGCRFVFRAVCVSRGAYGVRCAVD